MNNDRKRNRRDDSADGEGYNFSSCKSYFFGMSWEKMKKIVDKELKSEKPPCDNPMLRKIFHHFTSTVRKKKPELLQAHLHEAGNWLEVCVKIYGRELDSTHRYILEVARHVTERDKVKPKPVQGHRRLTSDTGEIEQIILNPEPQDASAGGELAMPVSESEENIHDMETVPVEELPADEPESLITETIPDLDSAQNIEDMETIPILEQNTQDLETQPIPEQNIQELETQLISEAQAQDVELAVEEMDAGSVSATDAVEPPPVNLLVPDIPIQEPMSELNSEAENLGPVPPKLRKIDPRIKKPFQPRPTTAPVLIPYFELQFANLEYPPHLRPSVRVPRVQIPLQQSVPVHVPDVVLDADPDVPAVVLEVDPDVVHDSDADALNVGGDLDLGERVLAEVVEVEVLDNRIQEARVVGDIVVPVPPWTLDATIVEEFNSLILGIHQKSDVAPFCFNLAESQSMLARVKEIIGVRQAAPSDQIPETVPTPVPVEPAEIVQEFAHTSEKLLPVMRDLQAWEFKPESKDKPKFEEFRVRSKKAELSQSEIDKFMQERNKKIVHYWIFLKTAKCNSFNFLSTLKAYYTRMERILAETEQKKKEGLYSQDVTSLKDKLMSRLPEDGWTNAVDLIDERTRALDFMTIFELLSCGSIEAKLPETEDPHRNLDGSKISSNEGGFAILNSRGLDLNRDQLFVRKRRAATNSHYMTPVRPAKQPNQGMAFLGNTTNGMEGESMELEPGDTIFATPPCSTIRRINGREVGRISLEGATGGGGQLRRQLIPSFNDEEH